MRTLRIAAILSLGVLAGGCDSDAYDDVASESIVDTEKTNLVRNGSFEEGMLDWEIELPQGAHARRDNRVSWSGGTALRLVAEGQRVREAAYVRQRVVPPVASEYSLRLRARTDRLNRRLSTELRVTYENGRYEFYEGHVPRNRSDGLPAGTSDWQPLEVHARPNLPVVEIIVYPIDTGPGPLRGRVWVDAVELHAFD
jgi:hypothetical protein